MVLLLLFIMGTLVFGLLLSKRQTLVQAASEGARAAVPIGYTRSGLPAAYSYSADDLRQEARRQTNTSLSSTGRSCPTLTAGAESAGVVSIDGISCTFRVADCDGSPATTNDDCLTVTVQLDNETTPLVPRLPLLSFAIPSSIQTTAVARLINCSGCT